MELAAMASADTPAKQGWRSERMSDFMLALPFARLRRIEQRGCWSLQMSVPENCTIRKRILPGIQGYVALKRKSDKQLQAGEYFLKFFIAMSESKNPAKRLVCGVSREPLPRFSQAAKSTGFEAAAGRCARRMQPTGEHRRVRL
jgi:hypothetical protein